MQQGPQPLPRPPSLPPCCPRPLQNYTHAPTTHTFTQLCPPPPPSSLTISLGCSQP